MRLSNIIKLEHTNIVEDYKSGSTIAELTCKYGYSNELIRKFLEYKNIPRRKAKRRDSLRPLPLVGKTFGQWTVISDEIKSGKEVIKGSNSRSLYWKCKCTCGKVEWKHSKLLQQGKCLACKSCSKKSYLDDHGFVNIDAVLLHKYNQTYHGISTRRNRGKRAPLTFNISVKELADLYEKQNHKCALSGLSIEPDTSKTLNQQMMSIDRKDSYKGYTLDNIQLVDKRINMMKGSLSDEEFIDLCVKVALYRGNYTKCL